MFRDPKQVIANPAASLPVSSLQPVPVAAWGALAMAHLGVLMVVGVHMLVVRDGDYQSAIKKLSDSGFTISTPKRGPRPGAIAEYRDPERVLQQINSGYKHLDGSSTTFNYPARCRERTEQVVLIPNSFAHLKLEPNTAGQFADAAHYDVFGNIWYPDEETLIESLVKAAIDEESLGHSIWGSLLEAWVSMMVGYLDIQNDIIDNSDDERAVAWYSKHFGRIYEENHGPMDRRITKRLGSAS
ncbi:hypothetical protein Aspvir_003292 [Aspergillus viridinutans]|uniref:Uncharacterized protein n=1 Tax=Aspergillus viridinutans TaxID=75553 RepID=A0A9P3C9T4_ASPVI|nr:uncharacterized protein Aspvir_003292 [Aspergillus viridinutans]GIK07626.1 hypothetical protein Aspvir_003292 [Aspergillus viridinutans]